MRDNFNQYTKISLAHCAGNKCSNPNCKKSTSGPAETSGKFINIGVASHITAAAKGGPRFDETLDSWKRSEYYNGIWLCQTCAKLIDSDIKKYTIQLLRDWKKQAEDEAYRSLTQLKSTPNLNYLEFSWIKLFEENTGWKEETNDSYPKEYPVYNKVFRRVEFSEIDPILDISLLNKSENPILITQIGILFDSVIKLLVGFGGPDSYDLNIISNYSIDIGSFEEEFRLRTEVYSNNDINIYYPNANTISEDQLGFVQSIISNLNILHYKELKNPLFIGPKSGSRFTLHLENYSIWHQSISKIYINTNIGIFYSFPILLDLMPN